jgi:hypothetical protein
VYALTKDGRAALAEKTSAWQRMVGGVAAVLGQQDARTVIA